MKQETIVEPAPGQHHEVVSSQRRIEHVQLKLDRAVGNFDIDARGNGRSHEMGRREVHAPPPGSWADRVLVLTVDPERV